MPSTAVPHLVYSSVAELAPVEMPDVATKVEIEAHLRTSSVPFTVVRLAFFVENFLPGGFAAITESTVGYPFRLPRLSPTVELRTDSSYHEVLPDRHEPPWAIVLQSSAQSRFGQ